MLKSNKLVRTICHQDNTGKTTSVTFIYEDDQRRINKWLREETKRGNPFWKILNKENND